eukprot:236487-Prymnesium_polylepis.1
MRGHAARGRGAWPFARSRGAWPFACAWRTVTWRAGTWRTVTWRTVAWRVGTWRTVAWRVGVSPGDGGPEPTIEGSAAFFACARGAGEGARCELS